MGASGRKPEVINQVRKARQGGSCVVLFYSDTTPGLSLPPLDVRSFSPVHIQVGAEKSTFFSVFRLLTLFRLPRSWTSS